MSKKLFVGGLAEAVDDKALRTLFEPYGKVTQAKVVLDRDTGKPRGFGYVTIKDKHDADAAVKALNGSDFEGETLRIHEAEERGGNPFSHGGGGPGRGSRRGGWR